MTSHNQSPAFTLRDGALKISIWQQDSDNGVFFTALPSKTYEKDGSLHDGHSFTASDLLRLAELAREAHREIRTLRENAPKPKRQSASRAQNKAASSTPEPSV